MSEQIDSLIGLFNESLNPPAPNITNMFDDAEATDLSGVFDTTQNPQQSVEMDAPSVFAATQAAQPEKRMSAGAARFFAGGLGFKDSVRGITQWAGYREEEMAEDQALLERLMDDPEYGTSVTAAYYAGMIADPVGWALPVSRLKHLNTVRKFLTQGVPLGAASGAAAGGVGYLPEGTQSLVGEGDMGRGEMAGLGGAAGAVMGPVAVGVGKGLKKLYEPIGDAAWAALKHPSGSTGTVGGLIGYNTDPDAPQEDKIRNAIMGAALGAAGGSASKFTDATGITQGLTEKIGDAIVPNYKLATDFIHSMNRFRGRKAVYGKDWDELVMGVREMDIDDRKVLYRMLQNRNFGMDDMDFELDKLGIASESREKIKEYGQALVDLGVLDDKTFTKNIDDYLSTSYIKHESRKFEDPLDMLYSSHHMFKMRGKVDQMSKAQWDAGQRPEDFPDQWELIDSIGGGKVKIRRQWTKEEKLDMGEIEDAAYALEKTGKMMSNERAMGEFFRDLAKSPDVVLPKDSIKGVKVPKNGQWGDLGGHKVDKRTWEQLKTLREWKEPSKMSALATKYKLANGIWKGLHTIVAPPVHFANVVSSGHMFDLADGNWADVGRAAKNMYKQDAEYQQMVEDGVFGSGIMSELSEGAAGILKTYGQSANGYLKLGSGPSGMSRAMDWTTKIMRQAKNVVWDNPGKLYQLEDNIWRAALYKTKLGEYLQQGMDPMKARGMAARQAKEFFVDYDQNPPMLNALRHTFLPFFSYTYGIMPRLAEVAAKNPAKYAKWATIYAFMNEAGENMSGKSEQEIEEIRRLQEPNPMFGIPGMPDARIAQPEAVQELLAPESEDLQSLNTERWLPGGKFSMTEGGTGQVPWLPGMVQPSGGVAGAAGWPMVGVNQFQGNTIPEGERASAAFRNLLPNWDGIAAGGFQSYANQKRERADSGETSPTKDDYSPLTARLSNAGIRIEPMNTGKMSQRIKRSYDKRIREAKSKISKIQKESSYSDATKEKLIKNERARIRKLQEAKSRRLHGE